MSRILWCDDGDHGFSENDLNRKEFLSTDVRADTRERFDICGPCRAKTKVLPHLALVASPETSEATVVG